MTWDIKAGLMGKRTFPTTPSPHSPSATAHPAHPAEREAAEHLLSFFPDLPPSFTVEHYLSARRALQDARWPSVQPLPGALRLVRHLHAHGVPLALATGSQRRNFALKSAHNGALFGCFGARVVCADDGLFDARRGKPHPDIFLVAAERFLERGVGAGAGEVGEEERAVRAKGLVFEDGIPGVQAGKRAGMNGTWLILDRDRCSEG